MKIYFLTSVALMSMAGAYGQGKDTGEPVSGKITFEEKVKIEITLEGDAAAFSEMLPKERTTTKELLYNGGMTLFRESRSTGGDIAIEHTEGVRIRMVASGENVIFTDVAGGKVTEKRDFMNRIFIVERNLPARKWKMTGNSREILGYTCMEAVSTDSSGVTSKVWFAPGFGAKGGPSLLSDLPGMVLEADINDGRLTFTAKSVSPLSGEEMKLEKPSDGKKVTEAEYEAIVAAKMKEMGVEEGNAGGGTQMHIVIKR
jgi:GLPGLI family protein